MKRLLHDTRGAAYVEFLIAFIPLFIMFLGMVQMALMYAGDLVVRHAAATAARAAIVVLPDDPQYYSDSPINRIDTSGPSSEDTIGDVVGIFGGGGGGGASTVGQPSGPRLGAIRTAASIPLMAISPSFDQLVDSDSVMTAIGGEPAARGANGALLYNRAAMAVTFPSAPGSNSYRDSFDGENGDQVTTRVTYLFHCGVPVANRLMCEDYATIRLGPAAAVAEEVVRGLADGSLSFDEVQERLQRIDQAQRRSQRDQPGVGELEAAGASDLMYLTWASGARFKVMRAEATLPLQHARYRY